MSRQIIHGPTGSHFIQYVGPLGASLNQIDCHHQGAFLFKIMNGGLEESVFRASDPVMSSPQDISKRDPLESVIMTANILVNMLCIISSMVADE